MNTPLKPNRQQRSLLRRKCFRSPNYTLQYLRGRNDITYLVRVFIAFGNLRQLNYFGVIIVERGK